MRVGLGRVAHREIDQGATLDRIRVARVLPHDGDQIVPEPVGSAEGHHRPVTGHAQGADREQLPPAPLANLGELDPVSVVQRVDPPKPDLYALVSPIGAIDTEQLQGVKIDLWVEAGKQRVEVARVERVHPAKDQRPGAKRGSASGIQDASSESRSDKPTRPFRQKRTRQSQATMTPRESSAHAKASRP